MKSLKFIVAVGMLMAVGCGNDNGATVIGSEEEYAAIRTSPEKEAEMQAKMSQGGGPGVAPDAATLQKSIQARQAAGQN